MLLCCLCNVLTSSPLTMSQQLAAELDRHVSTLTNWECEFMFPDTRHPSKQVDLCRFLHKDFVRCPDDLPSIEELGNYPENSVYRFESAVYGRGIDSMKTLRADLFEAARRSGFTLTTDSFRNRVNPNVTRELLLSCARHSPYKAHRGMQGCTPSKLDTQQHTSVLIAGVSVQNIRRKGVGTRKRNDSGVGNDRPQSTPHARKTVTSHPLVKNNCCPFELSVFLAAKDHQWYLRLSTRQLPKDCCPRTHLGHGKADADHLTSKSTFIAEEARESLNQYCRTHLSAMQSTHLLNSTTSFNLLPSQIKYLSHKSKEHAQYLTEDASSANKLVTYLESWLVCQLRCSWLPTLCFYKCLVAIAATASHSHPLPLVSFL